MATGDVEEVRWALQEMMDLYPDDDWLQELGQWGLDYTRRTRVKGNNAPPVRRGGKSMSDEEIKDVIRYARAHPNKGNSTIALHFGCGEGRVSEYCGTLHTPRLVRLRKEIEDE